MSAKKVVVLGMMSKMPVAGVVWQTVHYLLALDLLGFEGYYVEAHARTPSMLMVHADQDSSALAATFISSIMHRFGFDRRWAFHARHADGRCYGMSLQELSKLYRDAACILNLHGGTEPLPELSRPGRLVYVETDPVQLQVELAAECQETIDFLAQHCSHFSFAENWGNPDCGLPRSTLFDFQPTRQPVVLDLWSSDLPPPDAPYTTVGNWEQSWRDVVIDGETYRWSKGYEFLRFLDLPNHSSAPLELALSSCSDDDRALLRDHGWRLRDGLEVSRSIDDYRSYVRRSRGEFTVAKDQNVRLRTGWFSDRSATYLAAGRPVVTQDTGFGNVLPTGEGLFAFDSSDDILQALESIESDYPRNSKAAERVARDFFAHDVVVGSMLESLGLQIHRSARRPAQVEASDALSVDLVIEPVGKNPLRLTDATTSRVASAAVPHVPRMYFDDTPRASVVVVTCNNAVLTKLCLGSVLVNTEGPSFELIVVDNGSTKETLEYLHGLVAVNEHVQLIRHATNRGFPRAVNDGLAAARGDVLVILNNDTIVPPGWLSGLSDHLDNPEVGLVGPVTNCAPNESRVATSYTTYGELLAFAGQRPRDGRVQEMGMLTMFCVATRRDVFMQVGPLDESFGIGMFEDDDYAIRVRAAGYRIVCAEDVFVHHFGQGSLGALVPTGEHRRLFERNRAYFERKWGIAWAAHRGRPDEAYDVFRRAFLTAVEAAVPQGSRLAIVSKGDDRLLEIPGSNAWHFPSDATGAYAGFYPAESSQAVRWMEAVRDRGCTHVVFPRTSAWWLDHYPGLKAYLEHQAEQRLSEGPCVVYRFLKAHRDGVRRSEKGRDELVESGGRVASE